MRATVLRCVVPPAAAGGERSGGGGRELRPAVAHAAVPGLVEVGLVAGDLAIRTDATFEYR